ncbi:flavodoxin family protein [Opitutaceae bacterium EW11]|nr:flavodoxin family protein [Opitutaceae bacterium EW11]
MSTVSIVYFSGTGTTHLLAEAIAQGARSVEGTDVQLLRISPEQFQGGRWSDDAVLAKLAESDAIVFGTPTFMGGPAAQFKAFADATGGVWYTQGWRNKLAGGFTISGSPSGDKASTLAYLSILAAQHGMTWVNLGVLPALASGSPVGENRLGSYVGVMAQNTSAPNSAPTLHPGDAVTGENYGRRIAELAARLAAVETA